MVLRDDQEEKFMLSPEPPADPKPVGNNGVCSLLALVRNCAHRCSWKIVSETMRPPRAQGDFVCHHGEDEGS